MNRRNGISTSVRNAEKWLIGGNWTMCCFTRITSTGPTLNMEDRSESKNERALTMELKFECPTCGQHISATSAQIGVTAPCPHCSAAVTVPARQDADQAVFVLPTKLPFLKSHRKKILEAKVSELVSLGPIDESIEAKLQDFAVALGLEKADATDFQATGRSGRGL
jgi:predicted RNA-binding Zn-ribbon protein involved in translation (DUF1610 family)